MRWWFVLGLVVAGCERLVIPASIDAGARDAGVVSPCLTFTVEDEYLVNGHTVTTVAPWQNDALVFTAPGPRTGMVAHQIGFSGRTELDLGIVDMFINGAHFASDGNVYVGGGIDPPQSVIRFGRPPNRFTTLPSRPMTTAWVRDVSVYGSKVFALMDSNSLDVYDGDQWVRRRTEVAGPWGPLGRIVAVGDDEAFYIEYDGARVMHYANDRHTEIFSSLTNVFYGPVEAMGSLVVARSDGRLWRRDSATWTDLGTSGAPMLALAALGDAVVFSGPSGSIGQYHDGFGFCEPRPAVDAAVSFIQPIPGGLVVTLAGEARLFLLKL